MSSDFEKCLVDKRPEGEWTVINEEDYRELKDMCSRYQLFCGNMTPGVRSVTMNGHNFTPSSSVSPGCVRFADEILPEDAERPQECLSLLNEHRRLTSTEQQLCHTQSVEVNYGTTVLRTPYYSTYEPGVDIAFLVFDELFPGMTERTFEKKSDGSGVLTIKRMLPDSGSHPPCPKCRVSPEDQPLSQGDVISVCSDGVQRSRVSDS